MAFSFTKQSESNIGSLKIVCGGYNCSGVTGGDINTGLSYVYGLFLQPKGTSVSANQPVVNESLPKADGITIVTTSGEVGTWIAVGIG